MVVSDRSPQPGAFTLQRSDTTLMTIRKQLILCGMTAALCYLSGPLVLAQTATRTARKPAPEPLDRFPEPSVVDPGVVTTRQALTPAGQQMVFQGRVHGVAFGASSNVLYTLSAGPKGALVHKLDWRTNRIVETVEAGVTPGVQAIAFDAASGAPVIAGLSTTKTANGKKTVIRLVTISGGSAHEQAGDLGENFVGGIALKDGGTRALVALTYNDELGIVDRSSGAITRIRTGIAPFGVIVNTDQTVAYVSNWGGRFARKGDRTSPTGEAPDADAVVVDERGIAASGTVARVDLKSNQVTNTIEVGRHPTAMALDETRGRLYVANSNSDSISVIDTKRNAVTGTITIQPFERKVPGVAPEALVLSKDRQRLYAACAGLNAVAVINVRTAPARIEGLIPTGWYPNHIALSPDGDHLAVSTLLGVGSGTPAGQMNARVRYVHAYRGTLHVIRIPDADQLAGFSTAVAENNRVRLSATLKAQLPVAPPVASSTAKPRPVPLRAGDPSPIKHIVYVIKENRSYDQFFGDLPKGNGDPSLHLAGDDIIPNQRKLVTDFVLLDNFYANGGNSADGHQWVTQAAETDYVYWHGYQGRSYPKNGNDPIAFANSGFLWDNALLRNRTVEDFGEFAGVLDGMDRMKLLEEYKNGEQFINRFHTVAPIAPLNKHLIKDYPNYSLRVPDVVRARIFLRHIKRWEAAGKMPNLVLLQLPSDHTIGATPGVSTPKACWADNDLALGQVVEGLTHSSFWKNMLILVVEDDAQAGLDHVDGHRTVALAISPYIRRGAVDSTFYSQVSFIKTIEQILGLPAMGLFDLIANDLRNAFETTPDYTPYTAQVPRQSIYETNPPVKALHGAARTAAIESLKMDFTDPDAAPTGKVNRFIWATFNGFHVPYPAAKQGAFLPPAPDDHDDDDVE